MPNEKPVPQKIPLDKIHDLPGIPTVTLADKSYGGLVASILLDGVKEPVILRQREDGEYQLVSGYRRRKATELAKLKELPALVYDMSEKDALEYHKIANLNPDAPIPGKLVEKDSKALSDKKPDEPDKKDEAKKLEDKKTEAPKPEMSAPASTDKKPAAPEKKDEAKKPEEKKAEAPKPEMPASAPADKKPAVAVKKDEAKKPDEKEAETPKVVKPAPASADKKPAEPEKKDENKKPVEKNAEAPKAQKPAPAPATKEPAKPANEKEKKAAEAPAPAAADKEKKPAPKKEDKPAKAPAPKKEDKHVEKTAVGPTGTSITKLLGEKLDPPTEKDKKSLPIPGEGEAFSAVLHPAYLKKADINTFSVDRSSDDFKELFKSIERFGVKDPVLARFNKDGDLEILSGQRRHLIASELNYPVPTIIQQLDDDDARILVADGNLHREHISTYDLSRALRMKADSMKRKAGRKLRGVKGGPETDELIAKEMGMSTMKLNRLMKLSEATQQICDLVDDGIIAVSIAYNIAFLQPKHQDTVADLIGINVKVNNENTTNLKKIAANESLTEQKIRDVLEGKYPPKVVEKPKAVEPPVPVAQPMAPAPAAIPKSPDVGSPVPGQPADKVIPFPAAPASEPAPAQPVPAAPTQPTAATPTVESAPAAQTTPTQAAAAPTPAEAPKEVQDRENSYETKIVLRGDRLRKYFPDVSMTPLAIENSIYDALEERRQRQAKEKAKAEIFKGKKEPVK